MLSLRPSSIIRTRPAFTLLELVIVLVIMVGLTAIAWPNLARQLRKSELRESAQLLRSAIEECGYRAASDGQPTFLKLVEGGGSLESFSPNILAEEAAKTSGQTTSEYAPESETLYGFSSESMPNDFLSSSSDTDTPETLSNRSWEFSGAVVVRSVHWKIELLKPPEELGFDSEIPSQGTFDYSDAPLAEVDTEGELFGLEEPLSSGKVWWMPFVAPTSPSGVGRAATIELYDEASEETLRVTYDPVSGRVEVLP